VRITRYAKGEAFGFKDGYEFQSLSAKWKSQRKAGAASPLWTPRSSAKSRERAAFRRHRALETAGRNRVLCVVRYVACGNLRERHPRSLGCGEREPLGSRRDPAEDASRIRVYLGVMTRLRSQALHIARANGVVNIAQALWSAALDPAVTPSYRAL
jgi:hypothetical protein